MLAVCLCVNCLLEVFFTVYFYLMCILMLMTFLGCYALAVYLGVNCLVRVLCTCSVS